MSDSVRPHRRQPTRLPRPWDSPGKNTVVGCHFPLQCMKVKSESEVAQSCPTLSDPMDCSPQAPLSMRFSRQGYWSGSPFPSPGDLLNPGTEPGSSALRADSLPTELQGKPPSNDRLQMLRIFKTCVTFSEESSRGSTKLCSTIIV